MISSKLVEIMNTKDISIRELSYQSGIAIETISRARANKIGKCKLETLEKMAEILECKVKDLFEEK